MDEREFVGRKRQVWDRLSAIVDKASGRGGVRGLSRDELLALGPLYRRVSTDLAYARAHAVNRDLVLHLNSLVGRSHALLYEAETSGNAFKSVVRFYADGFPRLVQKRARYFLAAIAISVVGGLFAYWAVIERPASLDYFVPAGFKDSFDAWKSGKVASEAAPEVSGFLFQNNNRVCLFSFATGIVGGAPTAYILFSTGTMMGALSALMTQVHRHSTLWPGILPHGIAELTAIFICGGAGLSLGAAVLCPGRYGRGDAVRRAGKEGDLLFLGTIPLLIFAAIIEGMFSHLDTKPWFRYTFAGINGVMWYIYLFLPRGPVAASGDRPTENQAIAPATP